MTLKRMPRRSRPAGGGQTRGGGAGPDGRNEPSRPAHRTPRTKHHSPRRSGDVSGDCLPRPRMGADRAPWTRSPVVNDRLTRLSISAQENRVPRSLAWGWLSGLMVTDESPSSSRSDRGSTTCHPLAGPPVHPVPPSSPHRGSTARTAGCPPGPGHRLPRSARSTTSASSGD